ncbi:MAG: succinate dehydrogenase, hydrophobic membrane anchor protein [Pseudomonadota bacterium]
MKYATDRKRAEGLGSGRQGTAHHWEMLVSSMALLVVVPAFVITFGLVFGGSHGEVQAFFSHPVAAIVSALSLIVIIRHVMNETLEAVEDYIHGLAGKLTIVAVTALAYTLIATGLFALAKLAL